LSIISKTYDRILIALKVCSMLVIFGVFVLITMDVVMSVVVEINRKTQWFDPTLSAWQGTHGFVEYGLLWFTMLAAPWLARMKGHVFIDAVTEILSPRAQRYTAKLAYLVAFGGSIAFTYYSGLLLSEAIQDEMVDDRGIDMMLWPLYLPLPIAFALVAVEFLRYLLGLDDMYGKRTDVREGM
jgi:TRAP-type C4-dicarboxylate transport system permease small subunit